MIYCFQKTFIKKISAAISFILITFLLTSLSIAQDQNNFVSIIPQKDYQANSLHRFIFGDHWRDVWINAVKVPELDLSSFAGGLFPLKTGGGMQTKSLQLLGRDGKIYKFRSVDKFPARSLPDDLRGSIVEDFMQDQITTINPYSALIVSSLIAPTGILYSEPKIFYMPSSDLLNEFSSEYKEMLGTIEEKPDEYKDRNLNFAGANKIINTFKMFDELEEDNDNYVIATDYLKARLFDIFIGDRDRHAGQWDWAEYKEGKSKIYKPIPIDRDFAFPLYDGLVPRILTLAITSYVHYDYDLPSMLDITWEGRHLDRRILGILNKSEWDSVANFLQNSLTDDVIENAFNSVPFEVRSLLQTELQEKLKLRRDQLKNASDEFYQLCAEVFDIHLSNKDEYVKVLRANSDSTIINVYKKQKDESSPGKLLLSKTVDHFFTDEVRIHLKDGNDITEITGYSDDPILIVIDGGNGEDVLIDSSIVNSFTSKSVFYDSEDNTKVFISNSTKIISRKIDLPGSKEEKYEPKIEDRYHDFGILIPFSISSDYGLTAGLGGGFNFYDYKVAPYSYRFEFEGSYSYLTESFKIGSKAIFNKLIDNWSVRINANITQMEITRFNGFGNESIRDKSLSDQKYYQVEQDRFSFGFDLVHPLAENLNISLFTTIENSSIEVEEENENRFLNQNSFYGEGNTSFLTFGAGLNLDYRDNKECPFNGYFVDLKLSYLPQVFMIKSEMSKIEYDLRAYFDNDFITFNSFAFRSSGQIIFGDYPFFLGANLGGSKNLRGLPTNRYVGDASITFQSDWKIFIGKPRIIVPGKLGLKLFTDLGRIFYKDEVSKTWHPSFGAGLFFDILDRTLTINFDAAFSKNWNRFYFYFTKSF